MTEQTDDAEVREATPGDYLVTREEDGSIKPVEVFHESKRHFVRPLTYAEASDIYGDGQGAEELSDEDAIDLLKDKFEVPDLSNLQRADDLKPSSVVKLLTVIHKASEINADVERENGLNKVEFSGEKKTGSAN
jgi:hypothetical protein